MMEILPAIENRRSVRKYQQRDIPDELVRLLLESARLAPSGNNVQPWRYIVIRSAEMRERVMQASHNQKWMVQAPLFIAAVADLEARGKVAKGLAIDEQSSQADVKKIIRDTAIATEHLVLQAEHLGLSTCWVAHFTQQDIRPVLGVPENRYVVAVIVVGYGAEKPIPRPRRRLEELFYLEKWGAV
jgi:nitroreductase